MTTTVAGPNKGLRSLRAIIVAAAIALGIAASANVHAISVSRGPTLATNCTSVTGIGTANWNTPSRAYVSDNNRTTASVDGTTTRYLQCLNYGFTIPVAAKIVGITVNVERRSSSTSSGGSRDAAMRIVQGGVIGTTDRSTTTIYTTGDITEAHGGVTDLWGLAWTPANINAANFGAAFAATKPSAFGASQTISVDFIGITVTYAPMVVSIVRADANPTSAATASWTVTFSQAVTGVNASDFALIQAGGVSGAAITSVTGAGTTWTVTASTGVGNGTLGLNLVDNDSIIDSGSTPLGGTGAGNGNFTGEVYTISRLVASDFNACSDGSNCPSAGRLATRIANRPFAVFLTALKADGTVQTAFGGNVAVSLVGRIASGGAVGANNCPTTALDLNQSLGTLALTAGKLTQTGITVANVYRDVRVKFVCDATNCPPAGITTCSGGTFSVRPDNLSLAATITSPLRAGTVALGDTFTLAAQVSANGTTTTNYNGTPLVDSTQLSAVSSGPNVTGILDGTFSAASGGTASGTFAYDEVGYFVINATGVQDSGAARFTIGDAAGTDCTNDFNNTYTATDPTSRVGCWFGNQSASASIGRFTPGSFVLLNDGVPIPPIPSVTPFCVGGVTDFTYAGQPGLRLRFTLEARNTAGSLTQNYDSTYANGNGLVDLIAMNNNDNIDRGGRLGHTATPWPVWTNGQFVVDKTAAFSRLAAPDGPFDSLDIGARVTRASSADGDNDGIKVSPEDLTVAGKNGVTLPGPNSVRFGRLWLSSAYGSEKLDLPVPLEAQYWNGFGFVTNADDSCTTITSANIKISNGNPGGFSPAVSLSGAFTSGLANLKLLAPNARGSAQICVDLDAGAGLGDTTCQAATPANQVYLQAKRASSANYDKDPAATVSFGVYKGPENVIYQRENY